METHPVQNNYKGSNRIPKEITLRAYEVYCHLYGKQDAMIDDEGRGCRGGFDVISEIIPFLYARSFPKEQWEEIVDRVTSGLELNK